MALISVILKFEEFWLFLDSSWEGNWGSKYWTIQHLLYRPSHRFPSWTEWLISVIWDCDDIVVSFQVYNDSPESILLNLQWCPNARTLLRLVLQFFLFCFVYLWLFIIFRSESWRCHFDSLLFDSYRCHTGVVYIVDSLVDYSLASL